VKRRRTIEPIMVAPASHALGAGEAAARSSLKKACGLQLRGRMKRSSLLAIGLVVLTAAPACRREDRVGTTNTTSATVTPSDHPIIAAPAQTAAEPTPASVDVSSLPDAPRAAATPSAAKGTRNGSSATGTSDAPSAGAGASGAATSTATALDISGPSPAADTNADTQSGSATGGVTPYGNANATSTTTTTGAPLVMPGLDNGVTGGVGNVGAPFNYASPTATTPRPVGGAMRPGAASNPDTTSGAR
jgi:hypothetical protein